MKDKRLPDFSAVALGAVADAGEFLLEQANRTAPIEEGTLIGSGTVTLDRGRLRAVVAYDTPYAVRQHEDTRLRHTNGRRAKWLEHTAREQGHQLGRIIADRLRQVTR